MKHCVRNWMSKYPVKIDQYEDVKTAKLLMRQEAIRHVLIIDSGNLSGVLSERDIELADSIRLKFKGEENKAIKLNVGDLISRYPATISAEMSMIEALKELANKNLRSLPVVDSTGVVCGILTETDVLRYAVVVAQNSEFESLQKGWEVESSGTLTSKN